MKVSQWIEAARFLVLSLLILALALFGLGFLLQFSVAKDFGDGFLRFSRSLAGCPLDLTHVRNLRCKCSLDRVNFQLTPSFLQDRTLPPLLIARGRQERCEPVVLVFLRIREGDVAI